ncbi:MAG: hypothetical protein AAF846_27995 [Chloroflexota bacterium]
MFKKFLLFISVLMLFSIGATAISAQSDNIEMDNMVFEIAEDGNRFIFDDQNLFDDGMPAYGSAFVTQGYIYPEGTLNGSNGVLENGDPEFPDAVLGTWTCYGWMIGDGARTETGEWVVSTQIYQFNDGSSIITNGFEIVDFDVPYIRAVTGGTGDYRGITGEQIQTLRGFTDTMGVNITVEFQLDDVEMAAANITDIANNLAIYPWD